LLKWPAAFRGDTSPPKKFLPQTAEKKNGKTKTSGATARTKGGSKEGGPAIAYLWA